MEPIVQIVITKSPRGTYEVKLMSAERTIDVSAFVSPDDVERHVGDYLRDLVAVQ